MVVDWQVVPDEHVIDEGDDGDNFYVIDKSVPVANCRLLTHLFNYYFYLFIVFLLKSQVSFLQIGFEIVHLHLLALPICIHCESKKQDTLLMSITSRNVDRFSKLVGCWAQQKFCCKKNPDICLKDVVG